ncbi:odorant receptor Or2 [Apis mellifera caucasica]|uniref:Odorant receptor n=1 Tax=Apis mellifera TaxID=7460 RepID=A0A7M7IIY1_APIME|nr:odorant receptor Or2 [Apis mellifera]KAG6803718.1 odorant receptor Or2 [Apis mellifera caucasica]|eukprot:XP_016771075.1 odorant receptor Or2 [Apis mellifera]
MGAKAVAKVVAHSKLVARHSNKDFALSMTAFLMKIVGLWLAKNEQEQRKRRLTLMYTVIAILFGVWVQFRDFYYSWPNFGNCAYTACNILCLIMVLLKLFVLFVHRKEFIDLLVYTHENFWHTNYTNNELLLLQNCKRISMLCITLINVCAQGTIVSYVLTPIVENIGRNHSDRVLPFNMWVDLPTLFLSPYYEILFVLQVLSLYHVGVCYICFDNLLCLMNLHAATQFRILQHRLSDLGSGWDTRRSFNKIDRETSWSSCMENCYATFKLCVKQHQDRITYCHRLNDIFTIIVLGHILVFSLLMCLVGFQVLMANSPPTRRLIFVFHITGSLCQLLLFTYSCDSLIQESTNVGSAVYSGPWICLPMNRIGRTLRRDLRMVIIRSRKPCCLTASRFFPVSLETCTTVLSTAMSYFTLMRQSFAN